MKRLILLVAALVGFWLLSSPELKADLASMVCFQNIGCLVGDGNDVCVDTNRNGKACENGEPNLTMNAPANANGDEIVFGDLNVTGAMNAHGFRVSERRVWTGVHYTWLSTFATSSTTICIAARPLAGASSPQSVVTCSDAGASASAAVQLDQQVRVTEVTCAFATTPGTSPPLDAGDKMQICVKEMGSGASGSCLANSTFPEFNSSSTEGAVTTLTPNALTVKTSDYGLGLGFAAAAADGGTGDYVDIGCTIAYELP